MGRGLQMIKSWAIVFLGLLQVLAMTGCEDKRTVWIYTSLYKEVIAEMEPLLQKALPDVDVRWFQGGSENIAAKITAEMAAGGTQADIIMTSDPFWYYDLKKQGKLLSYESSGAKKIPAQLRDPDHAFAAVRVPVMVIGYNGEAYQPEEVPKSWKDLSDSKWKSKLSMGSPLESGTNFTFVAMLSKLYGWEYFSSLRKFELVAAGGNSSVISRIETRERPVGAVLLENILKARRKGSPVKIVYPSDGAVQVPSPIAILAGTKNPELSKLVYEWFFTDDAQKAIVGGWMYSPVPSIPSPEGAKPWAELAAGGLMKWSPQVLGELFGQRDQIKAKFSEVVLH